MKKIRNIALSEWTLAEMEKVPLSRSAVFVQSVLNAQHDPVKLPLALQKRMESNQNSPTRRVSVSCTEQLDVPLQKLVTMTNLSTEEVIRLSIEAYIHKL